MTKELERAGIPTVLVSALKNVAANVGVSRLVTGHAIAYPTGNIDKAQKDEIAERVQQMERCFKALSTDIPEGEMLIF